MQKLVSDINEQIKVFQENAELQVENGNKAAGGRARKASLELEKQLKASVKHPSKLLSNNNSPLHMAVIVKGIDPY